MAANVEHRLIELIAPLIAPLGYELVHVEIQTHRQKTLRLFIDFSVDVPGSKRAVGIEDCVIYAHVYDGQIVMRAVEAVQVRGRLSRN